MADIPQAQEEKIQATIEALNAATPGITWRKFDISTIAYAYCINIPPGVNVQPNAYTGRKKSYDNLETWRGPLISFKKEMDAVIQQAVQSLPTPPTETPALLMMADEITGKTIFFLKPGIAEEKLITDAIATDAQSAVENMRELLMGPREGRGL